MLNQVEPEATGDGDAEPESVPEQWRRAMEIVTESLQTQLGETVDRARIRAEVEAGFAVHAYARVRDFVPILVEMRVRSRVIAPESRGSS